MCSSSTSASHHTEITRAFYVLVCSHLAGSSTFSRGLLTWWYRSLLWLSRFAVTYLRETTQILESPSRLIKIFFSWFQLYSEEVWSVIWKYLFLRSLSIESRLNEVKIWDILIKLCRRRWSETWKMKIVNINKPPSKLKSH